MSRARFLSTECAHLSGRMHLPGCRCYRTRVYLLISCLVQLQDSFRDLSDTWADGGWQLCAIDATRGHSRDRSLMHPCYILIQVDDYWAFNHRPHGLLELVLGSRDLSFPCVLPQMINFPVLQAFLAPLLPQGLSCLSLHMWHNGAAVDYQLVNCFNGFFVQVTVDVNSILMDNIWLAAPLIIPQLHIDQVVLTDSQLLQVTAFVPLTMIEKRNRVFTILDSTLRQRFTDMRYVGFLLLTAHPSSKWMDPAFSPKDLRLCSFDSASHHMMRKVLFT